MPFIFKVPPGFKEVEQLLAVDGLADDRFGSKITIDGNVAVITAPSKKISNLTFAGVAYIYERIGNVWTYIKRIYASNFSQSASFGSAVSISGDTIVVGAQSADINTSNSGSAYIFVKSGGVWPTTETLILGGSAAFDEFGASIAVNGNTVVVGGRSADPSGVSGAGAAWIYERSGGTWSAAIVAKITASDKAADDQFSNSLVIENNTIVVGVQRSDPGGVSSAGAVYIFEKSGTWPLTETVKITASDKASTDQFGASVSISGNYLAVGADTEDTGGTNSGSVYIFEKSGTWPLTETQKVMASDSIFNGYFGQAVSIDGSRLAIGARGDNGDIGAVYIFNRGANWAESQKIVASDAVAGDSFSYFSVALSGNVLFAGSSNADPAGVNNQGKAYIFEK